ncbi:TPA: hypothetical protein ACGO02_000251 [Streptococcus suis]
MLMWNCPFNERTTLSIPQKESDCFVTIDLEDGLHESIHVKYNFEDWENDFYQFCIAMKIILKHYVIGLWNEAMAEMEVIGIVRFVEKYLNI